MDLFHKIFYVSLTYLCDYPYFALWPLSSNPAEPCTALFLFEPCEAILTFYLDIHHMIRALEVYYCLLKHLTLKIHLIFLKTFVLISILWIKEWITDIQTYHFNYHEIRAGELNFSNSLKLAIIFYLISTNKYNNHLFHINVTTQ